MSGTAFVRAVHPRAGIPNPPVQVALAVDTAYVVGAGGTTITSGIYVMDNELNAGSTGEGTMALHTRCPIGSLIGYSSYPIDVGSGDTVAITGFSVTQGNVFGAAGAPLQQSPDYWIAQAMFTGSTTFQIQLCITAGALRPTKYYVSVGCQLTAQ
jgi:hypothetical protein